MYMKGMPRGCLTSGVAGPAGSDLVDVGARSVLCGGVGISLRAGALLDHRGWMFHVKHRLSGRPSAVVSRSGDTRGDLATRWRTIRSPRVDVSRETSVIGSALRGRIEIR